MPKVDYAAIEERSFDPLPDDTYPARLTNWELKQGGKGPYYNLEFTLTDEAGEFKNRKVWTIDSLASGALWRFKRDMIRLGADAEDMAPGSEVDTDDIVAGVMGADCRLVLKQEEYTKNDGTNAVRSRVDEILAPLPF